MNDPGDDRIRIGCAIWAHKPWIGAFFDSSTRSESLLAEYARRFPTVEGNTTFYALPDDRTARRWREAVPDSFRFVFKMSRRVTHDLRLRNCTQDLRLFLDHLAPLHDVLGPIFIQLPPSFTLRDLDVLRVFVDTLPREFKWAVEMRHRDFFVGGAAEQPLDGVLRDRGIDRVIMDARSLQSGPAITEQERDEIRSKPLLPVRPVATGNSPIVRFIGQTEQEPNVAFWEPWLGVYAGWIQRGLAPYFFIHTPDNVASPHLVERFRAEVISRLRDGDDRHPTPEPAPPDSPK